MSTPALIITGLVAFVHIYILWFEMFAWESRGPKVFRSFPKDLFAPTKAMAANQGLYNGFLAAGLIWSFFISDPVWQANVATFFLACVAVAGIYGAMTASKKIIFVQTIPAAMGILLIILG
jgi:putative membrane protein